MLNIDNNVLFIFTFRNIFIKHAKENIFVSSSRKLISLSSSLSLLTISPPSLSRSYPRGCLSSSFSTVWSTYSNTRWSLFFLLNTSIKLTKFGCFSCCKVMNIMIISEFVCNIQYFIIRWHICQSFNVSSKSNNNEKK